MALRSPPLLLLCRLPRPMGEFDTRLCAETERYGCGCGGGSGVEVAGGVAMTVAAVAAAERGRCVCGFGIDVVAATAGPAATPSLPSSFGLRGGEVEKDSEAASASVGET